MFLTFGLVTCTHTIQYRKSSIKPTGGLFISSTFEGGRGGGLNREGDLFGGGGVFNLAKRIILPVYQKVVSILHKKTRTQSGKAQAVEVGGDAAENLTQPELPAREKSIRDFNAQGLIKIT